MNITKRVNIDRENRRGDESLFAKRCLTRADTLQLLTIRSNGLGKIKVISEPTILTYA